MAQQVKVLLIDDLDGGDAEETVTFALDGTAYEIDLSGKNAEKLRNDLAPYVSVARKAGRTSARSGAAPAPRRRRTSDAQRNAEIRAWAKAQGKKVSDRGRISADIVQEYEAAH
jgi:Lsr2